MEIFLALPREGLGLEASKPQGVALGGAFLISEKYSSHWYACQKEER